MGASFKNNNLSAPAKIKKGRRKKGRFSTLRIRNKKTALLRNKK
jgi:hypothetical protein